MKIAHKILLGFLIAGAACLLLLIKNPAMGFISLACVISYGLYSFFTHRVEKDEVAWVLFGGKTVGTVGPGYHLIPAWIFELETMERKFQLKFKKGGGRKTKTEWWYNLPSLTLTPSGAADAGAIEKILTFNPELVCNLKVGDMTALARAGGIEEAIDLIAEIVADQLQIAVLNLSMKGVIEQKHTIIITLTNEVRNALANTGLILDGDVKITEIGIPAELAQAAQKAALAVTKQQEEVKQAETDRKTREEAAAAALVEAQKQAEGNLAKAKADAEGNLAKAQAEATGLAAKIAALPGTDSEKKEILIAEKTGMPTLPEGLQVLITNNQDGGGGTDAATLAAIAAALSNNKPKA